MNEPLLHLPKFLDLCRSAVALTVVIMIRIGIAVIRGRRNWFHHDIVVFAAFCIAQDCSRDDLRRALFWIYLSWLCFGQDLPWDKWGKRLRSKLSSLTEVAKASLQRQTSEAFS